MGSNLLAGVFIIAYPQASWLFKYSEAFSSFLLFYLHHLSCVFWCVKAKQLFHVFTRYSINNFFNYFFSRLFKLLFSFLAEFLGHWIHVFYFVHIYTHIHTQAHRSEYIATPNPGGNSNWNSSRSWLLWLEQELEPEQVSDVDVKQWSLPSSP